MDERGESLAGDWAWHRKKDDKCGIAIERETLRVELELSGIFNRALQGLALYGAEDDDLSHLLTHNPRKGRLTLNVIANVIDTAVTKITDAEVRTMAMPFGGNMMTPRRAARLNDYFEQAFLHYKIDETMPVVARDGFAAGMGLVMTLPDTLRGRPDVRRIMPLWYYPDDSRPIAGVPRNHYVVLNEDRERMMEMYPKSKKFIERAPLAHTETHNGMLHYADSSEEFADEQHVGVTYAWRCATHEGASNGHYVVVIGGHVVAREGFPHASPPIAIFRPVKAISRFWGTVLACRGAPAQLQLNKYLMRLDDALSLHGRMITVVNQEAGNITSDFVNDVGTIMRVNGGASAIQQLSPSALPREAYDHIERMEQHCHRAIGVNEMASQSRMPAGITSGRAQLVYRDDQSGRLSNISDNWANAHSEIAEHLAWAERSLSDSGSDRSVPTRVGGQVKALPWSKIDVSSSEATIRVAPAGALPTTPAGRMEVLDMWLANETIDKDQWLQMSRSFELRGFQDRKNAPRDLVHYQLGKLLEGDATYGDGVIVVPEQDPVVAVAEAKAVLVQGQLESWPEEPLREVRKYLSAAIAAVSDISAAMNPPEAPPAAPAAPGMPAQGMDPGAIPPMDPAMDPAMAGAPAPPMDPAMAGIPQQ